MNRSFTTLKYCLALLALSFLSFIQAEQLNTTLKQTNFRQYSVEHGLSQSTINDFFQDSSGLMWIATESGLNRLDGSRIEHFDADHNNLSSNAINTLTQDSQGELWVATFNELVHISKDYNHSESYSFPTLDGKVDDTNFVISLIEQQQGVFWVITRQGMFLLKSAGRDIQPFESSKLFSVDNIGINTAFDSVDSIWLATDQGLYRFNKTNHQLIKFSLPQVLNKADISSIVQLDKNMLFISSNRGAMVINQNSTTAESESLLTEMEIVDAVALQNSVLFAVKDQLHHYHLKNGEYQLTPLFSLSEILPRNTNYLIRKLFIDQREKLWIGTDSQGAYIWEPNSINFKSISNLTDNPNLSLSDKLIWNFAEDDNNNFWIATANGINHLLIEQAKVESYLTNDVSGMTPESSQIMYILKDQHILWLGTADGLIRFNTTDFTHQIFKPSSYFYEDDFYVYAMTIDPNGSIWLATGQGAVRFNPKTNKFSVNKLLQTKNKTEPCTFIRFTNGKIWMGYSDRLETYDYITNQKSIVFEFDHLSNYQELNLTDIYIDENRIWVSFNATGIYLLEVNGDNTQVIKHFNQADGFIDNTVHSLISSQEFIWASTHRGLVKINKQDFSFLLYDFYDGLPINEFNEGSYLLTSQGHFLFGGANGFLELSPSDLLLPNKKTRATVTSLKIEDRIILSNGYDWSDRDVTIRQSENLLKINLTVLEFFSPHKWHYEYWLSGDKTTQPKVVAESEVTLANLPPGNYQFNVRVVIPNYSKFDAVTTFQFAVASESWSTIEVQTTAYLLLALLTFWFLYRRSSANKNLIVENKTLISKEQRFNLALLDKRRGVWDWNLHGDNLQDSTICMVMNKGDNLIVTLSQYKSYVHSEDLAYFETEWQEFLSGEKREISIVYRVYLYENWIWCRIYGNIIQNKESGQPLRASGIWMDISKERESQESLQLYKMAIESTRDIVFIVNAELNIVFVNHAYRRLTGYSARQLIGKNILNIARKRLSNELADSLSVQLDKNHCWQGEATMPKLGAPSYPVDIRIDSVQNAGSHTHYVLVMTDISSLSERMNSQSQYSYYDSLTGLPNKVLAKDRLLHAITHAKLHSSNVALVKVDLDNFDFYIKTLGKSAAREIIVNASKRIRKALNKDDTLARVEKDKFHVILENEEKIENISFKINRILAELNKPLKVGQSSIKLGACIGIAYFPEDALSSNKLIDCVDKALIHAQSLGENKIHYSHSELNKRASDRIAMKYSLQHALENNQFYLVFQPRIHLRTKKIHGFEAFIRWRTLEGNIIYPSQFIKIAEEIGMIEKMTDWLINQSFRTLSQWKQEGITTAFSINLNPKYSDVIGSSDYLVSKLAEYQLSPDEVIIEINEKHFAEDINSNLNFMNDLSQKGFKITLDDFGSGNTPLSYFKNLPVHAIKMERNFIRNIGKDESNDILLRSIIKMMNKLGKTPTAKGIEYEEQLGFLIKAGCHFGQGYYFSDPLTESAARQLLIDE